VVLLAALAHQGLVWSIEVAEELEVPIWSIRAEAGQKRMKPPATCTSEAGAVIEAA
jgi:hypothetical protein